MPQTDAHSADPDGPADSLKLRIGQDIDWIELAAVLERDDSTKGSANPKSQRHRANPNTRRFSVILEPKAAIIGLPAKIARRPSCHLGRSMRRSAAGARIFPKKAAEAAEQPGPEPASPKVSCMGNVLSEREETSGRWESIKALFCCGNRCGSVALPLPEQNIAMTETVAVVPHPPHLH